MTIGEFITKLKTYNEDLPVAIIKDGGFETPYMSEFHDEEYGIHCLLIK